MGLEGVTAKLVSELEAIDDFEETINSIGLFGAIGQEKKPKQFCGRARDEPHHAEPELPDDGDTMR